MTGTGLAEVATIGGLAGFSVYCFSCAAHVWRARNAKSSRSGAPAGMGRATRRTSAVLLTLGLLGMALSAAWQAVVRHEGLLSGDGIFTVRAPTDRDVVAVAQQEAVEEGGLLARFGSAESKAKLAELELRRDGLDAEKAMLGHQPLVSDPDIARKLGEANARERALRANLNELTLERNRVSRDAMRERSTRQDDIQSVQLEISRFEEEARQAESALRLCQEEHARCASLVSRDVVPEEEYARKASELTSREIEVRKLQRQVEKATEQRKQLERALAEFLKLTEQQEKELTNEIAGLGDQLAEIASQQEGLERRQAEDLARAARHREESLRKIEIELAQAEKQLQAEKAEHQSVAPFAGRLVYRAPAPGNALPGDPVVVLAPPGGLRLAVRVPRWMKSSLEQQDKLSCELLQDLERDEQRRFVEPRFTASFAGWKELPADPRFGLAEMSCVLSAEAVRELALGKQIAARLVWRPPLYASPWFVRSALLAALAAVAGSAARLFASPGSTKRPARPGSSERCETVSRQISTEFGAEGVMLRMLGGQLRETIVRGELDAHVIAAAEWALDRHRARATRLLALGLGDSDELCDHLDGFVKEMRHHADLDGGNRSAASEAMVRRLLAVLRAAAPAEVHARIRDMEQRGSSEERWGSNGRRPPREPVDHQA